MSTSRISARPFGRRWLPWLAVLVGMAVPSGLSAQTATVQGGGGATQTSASEPTPLARYIPRENLLFYFEFAGLDAHSSTWNKTAAYRLLNDLPLGVMLEEVAGQLLDKALSFSPNRRLTGPEAVTLIKHVAKSGGAAAVHVKSKDATAPTFALTMVLRARPPRRCGSSRAG